MSFEFLVETPAERLDRYLANKLPDHSRSAIQRWIRDADVLVNGRPARASRGLAPGDQIRVDVPPVEPARVEPEPLPLTILYEDNDLIAVDKPAGLVVHPAPGHRTGTLVNAILYHDPTIEGVGGVRRPGIVHRLDKDTSGILLIAKNDRAHRYLQAQFKARTVQKTYLALVYGRVTPSQGRIEAAIGRDPRHRKRMAVRYGGDGRPAVTEFEVVKTFEVMTLVEVHPLTGRTHQVRVHFASMGHPLAGDTTYGPRRDSFHLGRHFLHAHRLVIRRPADEDVLDLLSPLPPELQAVLDHLI